MSEHMLHILGPARWDSVAAIVGDRSALESLHLALTNALGKGAGGAYLYSSDGEGFALAVALEEDMYAVHTAYSGEAKPRRSVRERVPMRGVANFQAAVSEAIEQRRLKQPWYRASALLESPPMASLDT